MTERRLGTAADTDLALLARLPEAAVELIRASEELYGRVNRLDLGSFAEDTVSPARSLLSRLQRSF
jgi:regulator of CtrA degradation